MVKTLLYNSSESIDITTTGDKLTLDTVDRHNVAVTLYHADNSSDFRVQVSDTDSATMADWHNVSTQTTTTGFRFQGTVPERWVRLFENGTGSATGSDTADASIQATK